MYNCTLRIYNSKFHLAIIYGFELFKTNWPGHAEFRLAGDANGQRYTGNRLTRLLLVRQNRKQIYVCCFSSWHYFVLCISSDFLMRMNETRDAVDHVCGDWFSRLDSRNGSGTVIELYWFEQAVLLCCMKALERYCHQCKPTISCCARTQPSYTRTPQLESLWPEQTTVAE